MDLIAPTDRGLYCAAGDFHIDPWRGVPRAVITHAHADHARFGSEVYVCHPATAPILKKRLGDVAIETAALWRDPDAQRRRESRSIRPATCWARRRSASRIAARSGSRPATTSSRSDGVSPAFEPLRCDAFITESTFGLPIYRWRPQAETLADIDAWWRENTAAGRASVLYAYALGKAQRMLEHVDPDHRSDRLPRRDRGDQRALSRARRRLAADAPRERDRRQTRASPRALVLAPPSAAASPWLKRFGDYSDALASGWMQVRGNRRRRGLDRGFALSDHADWPGLLAAIAATGAERIFATHGAVGAADALSAREGARGAGNGDGLRRGGRRRRGRHAAGGARHEGFRRRSTGGSTPPPRRAPSRRRWSRPSPASKDDPRNGASAAWMVYFLAGGKPRQTVPTRSCAASRSKGRACPNGSCEECYRASAISPRRWRCCCRRGEAARTFRSTSGCASACSRCRPRRRGEVTPGCSAGSRRCPPISASPSSS